ncbi:hypothetical protein QNI19_37890 [Cytophagaceae bacterium DM2B3-1]|uniref:Auto-transporter adhesin head GIN domain-containing protein n=1 Tax=Xanthocytophaga flava TaxID=3048013 RepID=A0ABT7CYB2_9BACT|nr:hypothetical protein [Xanthocytophaga flavus]MDJ1469282.1 hypothetical protein [Xanthocytophaga flavus]MDJ1498766.1 hypothetical protein [Xanthocytophaga flavus]
MNKSWTFFCLVCFFLTDFSYGQGSPLSQSIVLSMDKDTTLQITYKNISKKEYVLWMQDWRVLLVDPKTLLISIADDWPLVNFLYIYPKNIDIYDKFNVNIFYYYDSKDYNILYESFKVLKPQEIFQTTLTIKNPEKIEILKKGKVKLTYIYGVAELEKILKVFPDKEQLFIQKDTTSIEITGNTFYNQRMAQFSTTNSIQLQNELVAPYFKGYVKEFSMKKSSTQNTIYFQEKQ